MATVIEIIADHLRTIGADGLVCPGECACELGHLRPCDSDPSDCQPGYRGVDKTGEGDWAMYPTRDAAEASKVPEGPPAPLAKCQSGSDGDCDHAQCPQTRDNEPHASGRSCPLYDWADRDC